MKSKRGLAARVPKSARPEIQNVLAARVAAVVNWLARPIRSIDGSAGGLFVYGKQRIRNRDIHVTSLR